MGLTSSAPEVPAHVPPELVVDDYPYVMGRTTAGDPFAFVAGLHRGPRLFYSPIAFPGPSPSWILRKAADLRAVYFDTEHFSNDSLSPFAQLIGQDWLLIPAGIDPPRHALYRSLMNPLFTPKAMGALDAKIRQYAREYVASFRERGRCEFVSEMAFEFPIKVFLELMGLPLELTEQFLIWEKGLLHAPNMTVMTDATIAVVDYLRAVIHERRRNPTDDLVSFGVAAEIEGRKLAEDELLGFCFNLFVGGLDTVSANMALHFRHLAEHPEHQATLRDNPAMIPDAIDELMRAYPAVTTFRTCIKERELGGVTIMPGDKVGMATVLAGRDPEEYARPNEIILDRKPRHVSFGHGIHLCIGMHLARREMRIAMEEFLGGIPEFRIRPGAEIVSYLASIIQPMTLPLVWEAT